MTWHCRYLSIFLQSNLGLYSGGWEVVRRLIPTPIPYDHYHLIFLLFFLWQIRALIPFFVEFCFFLRKWVKYYETLVYSYVLYALNQPKITTGSIVTQSGEHSSVVCVFQTGVYCSYRQRTKGHRLLNLSRPSKDVSLDLKACAGKNFVFLASCVLYREEFLEVFVGMWILTVSNYSLVKRLTTRHGGQGLIPFLYAVTFSKNSSNISICSNYFDQTTFLPVFKIVEKKTRELNNSIFLKTFLFLHILPSVLGAI